jgi:predicted ATPase/DNA-binding winged helix-turn-helix (wHTH) protein
MNQADDPIEFGSFRVYAKAGRLEKNGVPVKVARSAIDILIHLLNHAGEIRSTSQLAAAAWPDKADHSGNIRAHIVQLRRLIEDDAARPRTITNIPGRGYRFIMPASQTAATVPRDVPQTVGLTRIVGREDLIRATADKLLKRRFVTIVGIGGIGKTTIAHAVLALLRGSFSEASRFLDLGTVRDGTLLPTALASAFGLTVQSDDPISGLTSYLKNKRTLVVLDCCEHLVDELAPIVERLIREVPGLHILATSREPLRVRAENVSHIPPLAMPSPGENIGAAEAGRYPAVQLFVERAAASLGGFTLVDSDVPTISDICRKLDGLALAIELAAACVSVHGLKGLQRLIDNRFKLLMQGRRTANARHQTLRAMLDWSYDLLSPVEQAVLRRLAVFLGPWPLKAGLQVVSATGLSDAEAFQALGNLISKSLISVDKTAPVARYRLLDTTRSYARERLEDQGEARDATLRHAMFYSALLDRSADAFSDDDAGSRRTALLDTISNVRAALGWCFSDQGKPDLGLELVIGAGPVFLELSLLTECRLWAETALARLDPAAYGARQEMALQELLGLSLLFTIGNNRTVGDTLSRGYAIAEALEDRSRQLRLLGALHIYTLRTANFQGTMKVAEQSQVVARAMQDGGAARLADWFLGIAHHHFGDQRQAVHYGRSAIALDHAESRLEMARFGIDHRLRALSALARSFWLSGLPDQAVAAARTTIEDATRYGHPVTMCVSLIWTMPVFVWTGDLETADCMVTTLSKIAEEHSLHPFLAVGPGLEGDLLIQRGQYTAGLQKLSDCLDGLNRGWHPLVASTFTNKFAEGLLLAGEFDEALITIDLAIGQAKATAELVNLPEMLRIKGNILAGLRQEDEAKSHYVASIDLARSQFALSWELRTALDFAALKSRQGKAAEAVALVAPLHDRFTEGLTTTDLVRAKTLLDCLRATPRTDYAFQRATLLDTSRSHA